MKKPETKLLNNDLSSSDWKRVSSKQEISETKRNRGNGGNKSFDGQVQYQGNFGFYGLEEDEEKRKDG